MSVCKTNNPCQNSGYCSQRYNKRGYKCYCRGHYYGENCEKGKSNLNNKNDPSEIKKIRLYEKCKLLIKNVFQFSESPCKQGNPCQNGGYCRSKSYKKTGYSCSCKGGFAGENCQLGNDNSISENIKEEAKFEYLFVN